MNTRPVQLFWTFQGREFQLRSSGCWLKPNPALCTTCPNRSATCRVGAVDGEEMKFGKRKAPGTMRSRLHHVYTCHDEKHFAVEVALQADVRLLGTEVRLK